MQNGSTRRDLRPGFRRAGLLIPLLLGGSLAPCFAGEASAPLYRWVDEHGEVHYTDSVPSTQSKQGRTKLDEHGLQTESIPAAPTEAELRQAQEAERRQQEEAKRLAEQQAADKRLLERYRTSEEVDLTRDGKLAGIDALIQVKRDLIRANQLKLRKLTARSKDQPLAAEAKDEIAKAESAIREGYAAIIAKEYDKHEVRREFAALSRHYRKLKGLADAAPDRQADEPLALPNLVSCQGADQCNEYWKRALVYVRAQVVKETEILGPGLLIGFQQDEREDRSLTLTWTQESPKKPVQLFFDLQCKNRQTASQVCANLETLKIRDGFRDALTRKD